MGWAEYLDAHQARFIEELSDFIRIPSVSAKPENAGDVRAAGQWVVDRLTAAGIENAAMYDTAGHPVVCADWLHAGPDKPTILIYGHFDVQPAEPFDLWETPPFEPSVRGDRIYGRGATDDKGAMFVPIVATEALLKETGRLPVNVRFFFEGQEEIGSPDLPPFIEANLDKLHADMIFSADGGQWDPETPQLIMGLKGLTSLEITVTGPRSDLHSGMHGGGVANPAQALAHLLASMKAPDGRITIDGFYDDVVDLTEEDRTAVAQVPWDEAAYLAQTGAPATHGEPGYTTRENLWARPTFEINGLTSGWQGEGTKTVLPSVASAKVTCRLVANQNPERIFDLIAAHVAAHCPHGVTAEVKKNPGRADPFLVPAGHNASAIAGQVLEEVYGKAPYKTRIGGSIPVMSTLLDELGLHAVVYAFGHEDENQHAPNEFFRLPTFRLGQTAYVRLMQRLGE